jgi:predicted RNA-binding protein with PIN domain
MKERKAPGENLFYYFCLTKKNKNMKQEYHTNAVTNLHIRKQIKESSLKNIELAGTFNTSVATISKWRNRQELEDKSSQPHKIIYALNDLEQGLAVSIRKATWLSLDEVWEVLLTVNANVTRISVYRTFCRNEINRIPQKEREKAKKFKELSEAISRIPY